MASIRKRNATWQARIRRRGFPDEVKSFASKSEAEQWIRSIEYEMDRGHFVSRTESEKTTFGDVIRRYISEITPLKRGCTEETIRLTATLRHRIAKLSMANLTPQEMAKYRDDRSKLCRPNTVIRDLAALSSIINHARREWGFVLVNPVQMIRKPTMPPGRERVLSYDEEALLLEALTPINRRNPLMQKIVILAIESAMRRGELLSLEWQHVDLNRRVAFLPITKNGTSRHVPLSTRAVEILRQMDRNHKRVFPINFAAMEANFFRAVRRAGLRDLHFHDLRHTATSRMSKKIPNVIELASITGHTNLSMLRRYYHVTAEELALKLG